MNLIYKTILALHIMSSSAFPPTSTLAFASANSASNSGDSREIPLLPGADPDSKLPTIQLGETISFQEMGPVIINADGTTRRISNWDTLTEHEREVSWRRIAKRNEERRAKLLEEQAHQPPNEGTMEQSEIEK